EEDVTPDEETNFRDLYVVYSTDNGASWSEIQSITGSAQEEDVFPSVARDVVDGKLHLLWMRDEVPGIFLINEVEVVQNYMMYAAIPVDDILDNKLGLARVGIDEKNKLNNVFSIGEVYPNPASSMVTVPVNMKTAAQVSLKVIDMLGKTVSVENNATLGAGNANLTLDVANLKAGIYFCQVNAGGFSQTQKIVIQ
ncbi:MAG: T9SS type A sorting domain-containing protein, partial [Bacteroidia bacterium]